MELPVYVFAYADGGWDAVLAGLDPSTQIGMKNLTILFLVLLPGPFLILLGTLIANREKARAGTRQE